jgi:Acetyltransferase (GNAT) domain
VCGPNGSTPRRRAVRKAEHSDLSVEHDTSGRCVPTSYDLYVSWTERRAEAAGLPGRLTTRLARRREPLRNFKTIAAALGENCRVWVARHRGEAVASIITLVFGQHAVYWREYSDKALAGPLRANNLLQGLAIQDACEAGCRYYSMGESGGVSSLIHFKQTFGATPRRAVEVRLEHLPLTEMDTLRSRTVTSVTKLVQVARRSLPQQD